MNKLSLVGMQLPGEYKENFDVSSEGSSSGVTTIDLDACLQFYHCGRVRAIPVVVPTRVNYTNYIYTG